MLPTPVHQELAKHLCLIGTADVEVGHAEFVMFMSVKVVWGAAAALNVTALSAIWCESLVGTIKDTMVEYATADKNKDNM